MKKSIIIISLSAFIIGGTLTSCQLSNKNDEAASDTKQDSIANTTGKTINVHQDTATTYQKFIQESEDQISAYEKDIAEIKVKIASEKAEEKAKYEKKLAKLEQKNKTLKAKVIDYKNKQVDNWGEIQVEFKKDMNELGSAIADFFVKD